MRPHIVILDGGAINPGDNSWDELSSLGILDVHDRTPADSIVDRAGSATIVLTNKTPLSGETLSRLPELKFISVLATGYDVVDVATARDRGIPVSNVPEYATDSVAEQTMALVLELCRHVGRHNEFVRAGGWTRSQEFSQCVTPLIELSGLTMGIVGLGRIGRRVGELATSFRMNVVAADIGSSEPPAWPGFRWASIPELFSLADIVSLHCPLTSQTRGLVSRRLIERMKPTAFLVNTARGPLVDERDLAEALRSGRVAGAALDVLFVEPPGLDNPLLTAPNCLLTPHQAWASLAARRRLMASSVENVRSFLAGHPIHVVNGP